MVFSSLTFLFLFLPIVLVVYYLCPQRLRNAVLLFASLIFYGFGEPFYVLLLILSILFNYVCGLELETVKGEEGKQRVSLGIAIAVNLLLLSCYKYYGFAVESVNAFFHLALPVRAIALPIGISFYTFQAISYLIDVKRGRVKAQQNVLHFALYIAMFPQLIVGPIVRYADIAEQLERRRVTLSGLAAGSRRFLVGLGKKVLLANGMGAIFERALQGVSEGRGSVSLFWLGAIAYTLQIYFDFSGYSDMAIGLGRMFGFTFAENFRYPYMADSITDFWRRWHISLSTWFREYVYIPLGGNRKGAVRQICNLLVVWMLTGLWHGAAWNFLFWGLYYGVLLILEKFLWGKALQRLPKLLKHLYTLFFVVIAWVLFFGEGLGAAWRFVGGMFGMGTVAFWGKETTYLLLSNRLLWLAAAVGATSLVKYVADKAFSTGIWRWLENLVLLGMFVLSVAALITDSYNPFIYFRF
ncbi:MAG: MBOAT family protein [Lachnospiraceae bacterium]|nr:MBOAT family protein [Lachnospiraceae bacterium]